MFFDFFRSKNVKDRLVALSIANISTACMAAMQNHKILPQNSVLPMGSGMLLGSGAAVYLDRTSLDRLDGTDVTLVPFYSQLLNMGLASFASPYFEGDSNRALAWLAFVEAFLCAGLAFSIQAKSVPMPAASSPNLTFQQRFSILQDALTALTREATKNLGTSKTRLKKLTQLNGKLHEFQSQYCNFSGVIMNNPITLSESGFTYDKSDIVKYIQKGGKKCPKTGKLLTHTLDSLPQTNRAIKKIIEEKLQEFEINIRKKSSQSDPGLETTNMETSPDVASSLRMRQGS